MQPNWSPFNFISREFLAAIDQHSLLDEHVKSDSHVVGKAAAGTGAAKHPDCLIPYSSTNMVAEKEEEKLAVDKARGKRQTVEP